MVPASLRKPGSSYLSPRQDSVHSRKATSAPPCRTQYNCPQGEKLRSCRSRWSVLFCVALLVGVAAAGATTPPKDRKPAPEIALKDANGATVRLSSLRGKVVLLDFWATWCGGCKVEIPWFMDFQQSLGPKGLAVLGVSMDDGWDVLRPWLQQHKFNYPVVLGDEHTAGLYGGVDALPMTLLIDREGRIASVHTGLGSREGFRNEIAELLEEGPGRHAGASGHAGAK